MLDSVAEFNPIVLHARLPDWFAPFLKPTQNKSARGGRGSAKSHSFAQMAILRMANLLPDYPRRPCRILSARDFNVNLDESVKQACEGYINSYGLAEEFDVQSRKINHRNGSEMIFKGVSRNPNSFLSMEDFDVFWMEQAESLGDEMRLIGPTMRKPGNERWFVWNPHQRTDYCWQRFVLHEQPTDLSVHINYNRNPFWHPRCFACNLQHDWPTGDPHDRRCRKCGNRIWPGLYELELERRLDKEMEPSLYAWTWLGMPNDGDATHQILPYDLVLACVKAHRQGLHVDGGVTDFGFDIAEGGRDKCAVVGRTGAVVHSLDIWPGISGDLDPAARRCHDNLAGFRVSRLYYDAAQAMRGPLQRQKHQRPHVNYLIKPVAFGGAVEGKTISYQRGITNEQIFAKRNIQMAMNLRLRASNTVRLLGGAEVNPQQCLFINPEIPKLEAFLADLTQPVRRRGLATGKWELDKRGADGDGDSPDAFDALCLAFARDSEHGLKARYQ